MVRWFAPRGRVTPTEHGPGTDQGPRTKDGPGTQDGRRTKHQGLIDSQSPAAASRTPNVAKKAPTPVATPIATALPPPMPCLVRSRRRIPS